MLQDLVIHDWVEVPWQCPKCNQVCWVYPELFKEIDHLCEHLVERVQIAYWWYRLSDDNFIFEFCVANHNDPDQTMDTPAPDGTRQLWHRRVEGDLLIFSAPDGYNGGPVGWKYDRRKQFGVDLPRKQQERLAIRNRISMTMRP